jgi:hypothetical protein
VLPGPKNPTPLPLPKITATSGGNSAIYYKKIPLLFRYSYAALLFTHGFLAQ